MSFTDHLERDAARLREEFGPVDALVEVQRHGLDLIRAFCRDQRLLNIMECQRILRSMPRREILARRRMRQAYAMHRAEIDRRRVLCETVAKAWGLT